ncbi:MAG: hypothetical protein ACLQDY_12585 [Streptosporangiaceae bacterium]
MTCQRATRGGAHDRDTAAAPRREEDTVMADQRSLRDAQKKHAASTRNPLPATGPAIDYRANGRIVARPVICGPPERRARE